jgi:excisionase family DNA binding protein
MEQIMEERLMKPAEVADILQVSRAMAYKLLNQGEIPSVRIGKSVRVSVNSRPMCTSDSRLDVYHQKEYGGGQDSGFIGASEVVLIETNSFLQQ